MYRIRQTTVNDLDTVYRIIDNAVLFMRAHGNLEQWNDEDGVKDKIRSDIDKGGSYVVLDEDSDIIGTFAFYIAPDPTYAVIDGKWLEESEYGVIHRTAASGKVSKTMDIIIDYCLTRIRHIRIDTHKDNYPMANAVKRKGFKYCGVITLENGQLRDAYERTADGN